jgi:S-adenosyl-L-methionine hydrolase (adenosine-forming)
VPVVTLITDFGTADGYVGAVKGVILRHAPDAQVIDIAHDIPRYDVMTAAFALAQSAPYFPRGTIHVIVVDPGVGGQRLPVVVDGGDHWFVAPDNGVTSLAVPAPVAAYAIEAANFRAPRPSTTFHGRDVFAVAAGQLAAGRTPAQAGRPVGLAGALPLRGEERGEGDRRFARVVHVDRFGNLITDLTGDKLPARPRFHVRGYRVGQLSETYESVERGELLAYIGSAGTLELAIREGSAAEELDMARGDAVEVVDTDAD